MVTFIKPYNDFLVRDIGTGFQKQVHLITPENSFYFRSRSESESIKERLVKFILDSANDEIIEKWFLHGVRLNAWADAEIDYYKDIKEIELGNANRYKEFLDNFYDLLYYSTILPYWVMHAGDSILKNAEDTSERNQAEAVIKKFEVLRGDTRYPQVVLGVVSKYWSYLAGATGLPIQTVQLLLPEEVARILQNPSEVSTIENLDKRQNSVFGILPEHKFFFDFSSDAIEMFLPKHEISVKEIQGNTANKGKVSGLVKIVNNIADIHKVVEGDVIISINTSPSVMPALKKAVAIVTDEGGITCHAAIVSRELGIPCVIGTKIATRTFKDGDMVEVDADNGVVRKLN
jgi:phosphohistidine swiveling domain-containing protein